MFSYARKKVKEGKIVKVEVEFDDIIRKLSITGDFFLHPEELLDNIEKGMIGLGKDVSIDALVININAILKDQEVQMIGISPESLAFVIREALQ